MLIFLSVCVGLKYIIFNKNIIYNISIHILLKIIYFNLFIIIKLFSFLIRIEFVNYLQNQNKSFSLKNKQNLFISSSSLKSVSKSNLSIHRKIQI